MVLGILCAGVFWNAEYARKRSERGGRLTIKMSDSAIGFSLRFLRNFAHSASRSKTPAKEYDFETSNTYNNNNIHFISGLLQSNSNGG